MVRKKHAAARIKKLPKISGHVHGGKTCIPPKNLLSDIKNLRESEKKGYVPPKIKSVKLYFAPRKAKIPQKAKAAPPKKETPAKIPAEKIKAKTKALQKQVSEKPAKPAALKKRAESTAMEISWETIDSAAKPEAKQVIVKKAEPRIMPAVDYASVKKVQKPAPKPVIEEPVYEKKPPRELLDHNLDIIKPAEEKPEVGIIKYSEAEKPLNIVKDFETEADEALLKKGLLEPPQAGEPRGAAPADFRANPKDKWFGKRQLAPPPRPPMKGTLQTLQASEKEEKKGFWRNMFKPKPKKPAIAPEEKAIDEKITRRMTMHRGESPFDIYDEEISINPEKAERNEIFRGPEIQGEREWTIKSQLDDVLDMINNKGSVNAREIAKVFRVGLDTVESWGKVLEENKLIEIHYPAMGEPNFTKPGFIERKEVKKKKKED